MASPVSAARPPHPRVRLGARSAIAATIAVLAVIAGMVAPPAAHAAGGALTLNAQVVLLDTATGVPTGTPALALDVPAGRSVGWNIDYGCSNSSCDATTITVTLPSGITASPPNYNSSHVQSVTPTSTGYIFTMAPSLNPGTTGRITFNFATTAWSTVTGSTYLLDAAISDGAGTSLTAPRTQFTVRSGTATATTIEKQGGGAESSSVAYHLQRCTNASADPGEGPADIAAGSTLVAELPAGASFVSATSGGVYSALPSPRVTWTATGTIGGFVGCSYDVSLVLDYPTALAGSSHTVTTTWTGRTINESADHVLGTGTVTTTTDPPAGNGNLIKSVLPGSAAPGQTVSMVYQVANSGNTDWVAGTHVSDQIPAQLDVTDIYLQNDIGRSGATLTVTTAHGSDGIAGTSDDAIPFVVAMIASGATPAGFSPRSAWPNGHPALPADDWITSFDYAFAGIGGGAVGDVVRYNATVLSIDRAGQTVSNGQVVNSSATLEYVTPAAVHGTNSDDAPLNIVAPISTIAVRAGGPGQLPINVRDGTITYWLQPQVGGLDLRQPVMVLLAPEGVTLDPSSIVVDPGSSPLSGRTVQVFPNWNGTTSTLYRITFAPGSSLPANGVGYAFSIHATLAPTVYGLVNVYGYGSSALDPVQLVDNYWSPNADDADDKDGDGDTTEILAKWGAPIGPARSVSAGIAELVRGSWDTGFTAGPGTSNSSPGSNDVLRTVVSNDGSVEMDGAVVMVVLPRPGDTAILSSALRNPTSATFPVVLTSPPALPTLGQPVTVSYTTVSDPCRAELGYSPAGCNPPAWSTAAPSDLATVTAVLIDFGANVLKPGLAWTIDLGATTPTSGATEPDFAVANPVNGSPSTDEKAYGSAAFKIKEVGTSSYLTAAEAPRVGLAMPGSAGPAPAPPAPVALTTSGIATAPQRVSVTVPTGGSVSLLDGAGTPTTTLVVPGVGTYRLDGSSLVFAPALGYTGTPAAVSYRVTDAFAQTGDATYTPTVTAPAPPVSVAVGATIPQSSPRAAIGVATPTGGSIQLMDGATPVSTLTVPGEGTYTVDSATSSIVFVPAPGFSGAATPPSYRVVDAYGQASATSLVQVTVVAPTSPGAQTSSGYANTTQSVTVTAPTGVTMELLDPNGVAVTSVIVPGAGEYRFDPATGTVSFVPDTDYVGTPPAATIRWTDQYAQSATGTYQPQVLAPPGPLALPIVGPGGAGTAHQSLNVPVPPGGRATLLDGSGQEVSTVSLPGVGTWAIDPATGAATFTPVPGYLGTTPAVGYRILDRFGQSSDATIVTSVTLPSLSAPDLDTSGPHGRTQQLTLAVPVDGSATLVDADGVAVTTLRVAGEGLYVLDPQLGLLTFTPDPDFSGTTSISYRLLDAYGQVSQGRVLVAVTPDPALVAAVQDGATGGLAVTGSGGVSGMLVISLVLMSLGGALLMRRRMLRRRYARR